MLVFTLECLVKVALMLGALMGAAAYLVLVERRVAAWIQDRQGPNRVGIPLTKIRIFGLGQPIADGVKFIFKEELTPKHVDKLLYFLGPMVMLGAALAVFAVVPFGSIDVSGLGIEGFEKLDLIVAPGLDVGMVYIFAIGGIAVYGVLLGSWASNNKYSFLGGVRSVAQVISYEIPLGLGILGVVLVAGSLRLDTIIAQQAHTGVWNVLFQPVGFLVFAAAAFAESGRLPFDLAEAEQELVGGYQTEYSGMKLMMYLVGEFLHMIMASFLIVILFLGGWHFWGITGSETTTGWLTAGLRVAVLVGKVLAMILFFMIARWSWPRFRFDQVMNLAWKVMLPLGLVNLVVVACWIEFGTADWQLAVLGWIALGVAWGTVMWAAPSTNDNRPRFGPEPVEPSAAMGSSTMTGSSVMMGDSGTGGAGQ